MDGEFDNRTKVSVVSFGHFEKELLEKITQSINQEFLCQVTHVEAHTDLNPFFDAGRRQYNGNKLLQIIDTIELKEATKIIGLFSVDLFIPILTYIFGQAYLNGRTGIASLYRLGNERYGMPSDPVLLGERFIKEIHHELGHMFGLIHCHVTECVMKSSTYVEDIDQKTKHLCTACREKFKIQNSNVKIQMSKL